jgi:hypothetical protein
MDGVNFEWIFLPPGESPIFNLCRIEITTGVSKKPIEKDVITVRIKLIRSGLLNNRICFSKLAVNN